MIKIFIASILNPAKAIWYLSVFIKQLLRKKRGILFIIGMDVFGEFSLIFRGYQDCYGFEPNPERYYKLLKRYGKHKNIHLYNVAAGQKDGYIKLNITNNNGASSSIGTFNENWNEFKSGKVKIIKSIQVSCINLYNFCKKNDINFIDDYISDIQGMYLQVLKTMEPMLDNSQIGTIRCEVTKDKYKNVYLDLPDNSEKGFQELLNENYQLIAKGLGILSPHKFDKI